MHQKVYNQKYENKKRQTTNKHDDSLKLPRYRYIIFLTNDLENFGKPVRGAVMQLY